MPSNTKKPKIEVARIMVSTANRWTFGDQFWDYRWHSEWTLEHYNPNNDECGGWLAIWQPGNILREDDLYRPKYAQWLHIFKGYRFSRYDHLIGAVFGEFVGDARGRITDVTGDASTGLIGKWMEFGEDQEKIRFLADLEKPKPKRKYGLVYDWIWDTEYGRWITEERRSED